MHRYSFSNPFSLILMQLEGLKVIHFSDTPFENCNLGLTTNFGILYFNQNLHFNILKPLILAEFHLSNFEFFLLKMPFYIILHILIFRICEEHVIQENTKVQDLLKKLGKELIIFNICNISNICNICIIDVLQRGLFKDWLTRSYFQQTYLTSS